MAWSPAMIEALRYRVKTAARFAKEPRKIMYLVTTRAGLHALRYLIMPPSHGQLDEASGGIAARRYGSYDDYIRHQRSKLPLVDLGDYYKTFRANHSKRLNTADWAGKSVLCLAARIGTEVRAFPDAGAYALGIDLEPGEDNRWVLPGDFHNLVFPDACVDGVYCNSLDHALDLRKLLKEVKRILKPTGALLVDAQHGSDEFDDWAATSWRSVDDLISAVEEEGFVLEDRQPITVPQPGEQLRFQVATNPKRSGRAGR
jgi:SAM-dependent methyltransferase